MSVEEVSTADVRGYLHRPEGAASAGIVLGHGAGSNADAPLMVSTCKFFAEQGWLALRIHLPFRLRGGAPTPAAAVKDREGLRSAVSHMRGEGVRTVVLGGHSYGGRQSSMLAAEDSSVAAALLLLSYPLHPPAKPEQLRTAHFPELRVPCLFVHGAKDPFGTLEEMRAAVGLIPARVELIEVQGAGHDLRKAPLPEAYRRVNELISADM